MPLSANQPRRMSRFVRGEVENLPIPQQRMKIKYPHALVAESVDALDLKSNRGSPSVPVQVWPRAIKKDFPKKESLFLL